MEQGNEIGMDIGTKIAVVGVSASGKSIFARRLAAKIHLPLIHTDTIMWRPGWEYVGDAETVKKLQEESTSDQWIIEGFIEKAAFNVVLGRADTIVYLDYSRHIPAFRYIKRWIKHRNDPRPELEGCPEKFSFEFLKRVWDRKEVYRLNKFLQTMPDPEKVMRLKSPREAESFLLQVG